MTDEKGLRLAKRNGTLSLRSLREGGAKPETLIRDWSKFLTLASRTEDGSETLKQVQHHLAPLRDTHLDLPKE